MIFLGRFLEKGAFPYQVTSRRLTIINCHGSDGHYSYQVTEIVMKLEVCSQANCIILVCLILFQLYFSAASFLSVSGLSDCNFHIWLIKPTQALCVFHPAIPLSYLKQKGRQATQFLINLSSQYDSTLLPTRLW